MEVDVVVERRTEAVQEGDATEPREGSTRCVGSSGDTGGRDQSPLNLVEEDSRDGGDGSGSVGQKAPQPLKVFPLFPSPLCTVRSSTDLRYPSNSDAWAASWYLANALTYSSCEIPFVLIKLR